MIIIFKPRVVQVRRTRTDWTRGKECYRIANKLHILIMDVHVYDHFHEKEN